MFSHIMQSVSYNYSATIKQSLKKSDEERKRILLTLLSPDQELRERWQAIGDRIYWSLCLSEKSLTRKDVENVLTQKKSRIAPTLQQDIIRAKSAMDYVKHNFLVTDKPVSQEDVRTIYRLTTGQRCTLSESMVKNALNFLQSEKSHPIVSAGIAHILFVSGRPFDDATSRLACMMTYLMLYRGGYEYRGFLVLEEQWKKTIDAYQTALRQSLHYGNSTVWLEYFCCSFEEHVKKWGRQKRQEDRDEVMQSTWKLTARQKYILSLLDDPQASVTNRDVQTQFRVSQVTASRDLAKLAANGLVRSHGKGRSVSYSRV